MANFNSVKGSGNTWNPKEDADGKAKYDVEENDPSNVLQGFYVDKKDGVGEHGSSIAVIEDDNQVRWDVWLDTVLNDLFSRVRLGSYVQLVFEGKKLKKASMGKNPNKLEKTDYFNKWDLKVASDVTPMDINGTNKPQAPQPQGQSNAAAGEGSVAGATKPQKPGTAPNATTPAPNAAPAGVVRAGASIPDDDLPF